ncbi:MAG: imidazole glycerol phosphate synthase subunit HisH [Candidatus Acidiferrales bacterium]
MIVTLVDYGAGNLASVERALERLGAASRRSESPKSIERADALLLPGVGHFAALIRGLDERGLREPLCAAIRRGVPFLGICLGLQALYESSEEAPDVRGLNIFEGSVRGLPADVKLPHMGWNRVKQLRESSALRGVPDDAYFYFAHSYAARGEDPRVVATSCHGVRFAAAVEQENVWALQFHPEKSAATGAAVLQNFLNFAQ